MIDWAEIIKKLEEQGVWSDIADKFIPSLYDASFFDDIWFRPLWELREIHEAMILDGSAVGFNPYRRRVGMKELFEMPPRDDEAAPKYLPLFFDSEYPAQDCVFFRPVKYKTAIGYKDQDGNWIYPSVY